jgi:photosystem II stability/assembly factor-like uncharacterized protein
MASPAHVHPFLAALVALGLGAAAAPPGAPTRWEPLKIGAGGFVTGIDFDRTGATYVVRTDTYGAYVGDGSGAWSQLIRSDTMPADALRGHLSRDTPWLSQGVYEIRVAPSDPRRLYMIFAGSVWRSDDRGASWRAASEGYVAGALDPNDGHRTNGEKMAVDPANPEVVYAGSAEGLHVTTNGGASWRRVGAIPAPTPAAMGITGIVFDPTGGAIGGRTRTLFATSNGNGVYRSTDAGASWSRLPGGPTSCAHATVASDGLYLMLDGDASNTVYRWVSGAWATSLAHPRPDGDVRSIAVDPFDPARVIVGRGSGQLSISTDHGASFTGWNWAQTRTATDVPWLAAANEESMSNAQMRFDPVVPDKLWFAEGIGVWVATSPRSGRPTAWISRSLGIEQLVAWDVLVPPGSRYVLTAGMDRCVFRVSRDNSSYPSDHVKMGSKEALIPAWALDASRANPRHLVAIVNDVAYHPHAAGDLSGFSLDGGATWTRFPTQPATGAGGNIVAPSIDDIIAIIGGDGHAYRSTDRGASWSRLPGVPGALHGGGWAVTKQVLAVDGADPATVYLYATGNGVWRSTDGGATWARRSTQTALGDYFHTKLRSVPGRAGHLFLASGRVGWKDPNPHDGAFLYRSRDGGATWTRVAGIGEPYDVAIGKGAPGREVPAIYVVGWYHGTYGIWRSIDDAETWSSIGTFPSGSLDQINVLKAATDVYGELYAAFQGSGWARGESR